MSSEKYTRRLTAIFSADVAGYSRLMGQDEAATVNTITHYREIMSDLVAQSRGRIVDSPGDNVLAEFASVVDAAQCAVAVQKEIQARNMELSEDRKMQFRIGINLGDIIEEGERIYGDGVNIAARLESLADPGGICISKTAFDHIETKLPLGYEYIGEQPVKNISKPVSAYKVIMDPRVTRSGHSSKKKIALPPWAKKAAIIAGIVIVTVALAFGIWAHYLTGRLTDPVTSGKASIVVLPFSNMSGDAELEHFSDGITEELIGRLAHVSGLKVISKTSAFFYKDKVVNLQTIGKELKVGNVLEGSVRKSGNKIRISAQLINVVDDTHIWSESYERGIKDAFAIQDEISKAVAQSLKMELLGVEDEPLAEGFVRRFSVDTIVKKDETVDEGLSAFGANIEIAGTVNGGVEAFAANIDISGETRGDLRFVGANVALSGKFLKMVKGAGANVTISGVFEDDLKVTAARITITPSAVIKGDFIYSTALFVREEGSQILGKVIQLGSEEGKAWIKSHFSHSKAPDFVGMCMFWLVASIAFMVVGFLVNIFLPRQTEKIVSLLRGSLWKNLWVGLVFIVLSPVFIALCLGTVIGIPAGIMAAFIFVMMLYISRVYVALWIGRLLLGRWKESLATCFFWPFVTGTALIGLLLLIPWIDWPLRTLILCIGMGAMWQVLWGSARPSKKT
jgi:TolB-like protein/class 3 adenylate cyclase